MASGDEKDLRLKCICARCPTYAECVRKADELLFCIKGKASCKLERYGCICGMCPVQKIKGFSGVNFCINGKAVMR